MRHPLAIRLTTAVLAVSAAAGVARAQGRYWAMFRNGAVVTADRFTDGDSWDEKTKLAGQPLFATPNPVCVLRDNTLTASPPGPHVLMANWDVVPGKVVRFLPASPELGLPPRLLLTLSPPLKSADKEVLTVRADRVQRVVATRLHPVRRDPGTLGFANGKTITATSLRWTQQGVKALTPDGIATVLFSELAEINLPEVDVIAAVFDDAVYPPLDLQTLVGRLEVVNGAVLTYQRAMTRVAVQRPDERPIRRSRTPPERFLHLKPAWALDTILVPVDAVYQRTYRAVGEMPLSLMPAVVLKEKRGIHHWPWRRNRSVTGGTLQSGRIAVGLGIGTHPYSEIAFELPPGAVEFTGLVGLDDVVGSGGCARAKVYRDKVAGSPAFASGLLRGSHRPECAGPISLAGAKRLVLVTEFAHQDRPTGADPFDIRDHVDWLMPMLILDGRQSDRAELLRRFVPGWQAWNLDAETAERMTVSVRWVEALKRWLPVIGAADPKGLTLTRTVGPVSHANDLLQLDLSAPRLIAGWEINLRVDGKPIEPASFKHTTTQRERNMHQRLGLPLDDAVTIRWDLRAYRGREVELTLSLVPGEKSEGLTWRGSALKSAISNLPPDRRPL